MIEGPLETFSAEGLERRLGPTVKVEANNYGSYVLTWCCSRLKKKNKAYLASKFCKKILFETGKSGISREGGRRIMWWKL